MTVSDYLGQQWATLEHPFFVRIRRVRNSLRSGDDAEEPEGEWQFAGTLQPGDELLRANGVWVTVRETQFEERNETVYNLEVAENHDYFVGSLGLLVHNGTCQTIGELIAGGHSFEKHLLVKGDLSMGGLGIRTREQLGEYIDGVIKNASGNNVRQLSGGRTAYWDDAFGTVIIHNPNAADAGTIFRPDLGREYFDKVLH